MFGVLIMIGYGLFRILVLGEPLMAESAKYGIEPDPKYADFTGFAMVALLARTFSSGCAALTGVEAISNGVPARKPKSQNAATTLLLLGVVAVTMVIGVVVLANLTQVRLIDEGRSSTRSTASGSTSSSRRRSPSWPRWSSTTSSPVSTSSSRRPS